MQTKRHWFLFLARKYGINDVSGDTVNIISHAAQERLRDIVEKLSTIAEHRIEIYKVCIL